MYKDFKHDSMLAFCPCDWCILAQLGGRWENRRDFLITCLRARHTPLSWSKFTKIFRKNHFLLPTSRLAIFLDFWMLQQRQAQLLGSVAETRQLHVVSVEQLLP